MQKISISISVSICRPLAWLAFSGLILLAGCSSVRGYESLLVLVDGKGSINPNLVSIF